MTSQQSRQCPRSEVEHVRKFVAYAKFRLNEARYYPPLNGHRYMVALMLYSKCLTVAEAILVLVDAGFSDEAFGMTRTLVDIFFTLRYIANQDTEARAKLYYEFASEDVQGWHLLADDYWPQMQRPMSARTKETAAKYPHPHRWSGKPVSAMALEPDTIEVDGNGNPIVYDFAYRVMFRWTSHYVHPTIVSLLNHVVRAGRDNFVVHSGHINDNSSMTLFNVASYVGHTMACFYRCMGHPQPDRVGTWSNALMKHLVRRHK